MDAAAVHSGFDCAAPPLATGGAAAGRCGVWQDHRRISGSARGREFRLPGRPVGAHRGAGRAAHAQAQRACGRAPRGMNPKPSKP